MREGDPVSEDDRADALKLGLQRAGLHWLRAGYEIVAGVGAFLDEVVRVRRNQNGTGEEPVDRDLLDPTRIDLE
jgi:hypothetical protein